MLCPDRADSALHSGLNCQQHRACIQKVPSAMVIAHLIAGVLLHLPALAHAGDEASRHAHMYGRYVLLLISLYEAVSSNRGDGTSLLVPSSNESHPLGTPFSPQAVGTASQQQPCAWHMPSAKLHTYVHVYDGQYNTRCQPGRLCTSLFGVQ